MSARIISLAAARRRLRKPPPKAPPFESDGNYALRRAGAAAGLIDAKDFDGAADLFDFLARYARRLKLDVERREARKARRRGTAGGSAL